MIKRYEPPRVKFNGEWLTPHMGQVEHGGYVSSKDYDQLQARCEELEAAHKTERQDRLRLQDRFIEMERENAQQRERIRRLVRAGNAMHNEFRQWLATEDDPESVAVMDAWSRLVTPQPEGERE